MNNGISKYAGHRQRNMNCFPRPGLENDTLSSSKTHTWWSAGWIGEEHSLLYSLPDNEEADWEKAPEAPDGSKFVEQLASRDSTGHACFFDFTRFSQTPLMPQIIKPCSGYNFEA